MFKRIESEAFLKTLSEKEISGRELSCILHNEDLYEDRHFIPTHTFINICF